MSETLENIFKFVESIGQMSMEGGTGVIIHKTDRMIHSTA